MTLPEDESEFVVEGGVDDVSPLVLEGVSKPLSELEVSSDWLSPSVLEDEGLSVGAGPQLQRTIKTTKKVSNVVCFFIKYIPSYFDANFSIAVQNVAYYCPLNLMSKKHLLNLFY